jgi:MYXO-CTERM domain-containing protein
MKLSGPGAFLFTLLASAPAFALNQSEHRSISETACLDHGLDANFCELVGTTAYNVDASEWSDPAAHAQAAEGQSKCAGANAAANRVATLTASIRAQFSAPEGVARTNAIAVALGRVLHTVQDNCAHDGQPNSQHAWASLSDSCYDTDISPDVQPEAIDCATQETGAAITEFIDAMAETTATSGGITDVEANAHWPARGDVCAFLDTANSWDGVDRRWDHPTMVANIGDVFALGISGAPAPGDLCASDPHAIDPPSPAPVVDTSGGEDFCFTVKLYCIGKADSADAAPPWVPPEAPAPQASNDSGGCSLASPPAGSSGATWLLASLALLLYRRRRR